MIETPAQHAAWIGEPVAAVVRRSRRAAGRRGAGVAAWRIAAEHATRRHARRARTTPSPAASSKYLFSTDHKMIAMQYMFTGMAMALIGGFFAYVFRMQMAFPGMDVPFFGLRDAGPATTRWSPTTARS